MLPSGYHVGPYEIVGPLGSGGFGDVYKARDTRLDRTVAIKILPSADLELKARFEREAKAIAALQHPRICTLFDVGHQDGTDYLVLEYLEGETLAARLQRGPIKLQDAMRMAVEILDALDKAHRAGIVHRDLKPSNIMLTKGGVKLLDFGLAKLRPVQPGVVAGVSVAPTQATPLTGQGSIVGTLQYMAPEQLEGKEADHRADIWAFGSTLYEMVTGRKTFSGGSQASLISAIMTQDPVPISQIEPMTPRVLDRVVKACLVKDPENRWQSANDLKRELTWIAEGGAQLESAPIVARPRRRELLAWSLAAATTLLLGAAIVVRYGSQAATPAALVHSSIVLPVKDSVRAAVLSPDGTRLAFVAKDSTGKNLLWIRPLDSLALRPLAGTENPAFPFWSPDSRFIGFFADGRLKKIDAAGGPAQTLCDVPISRGGTWSSEGVILFAPHIGPLFRVSASGGAATPVTRFDASRGENSHRWPFFLPDGRHFLYLATSASVGEEKAKSGIYVGSLDSTEEAFLLRANSSVTYAPPGYLLFVREGNLLAQRFDPKSLKLAGEPLPVAEQIQHYAQTYNALFSASDTGLLLYEAQSRAFVSQLVWFDRSGRSIGPVGEPCVCANPRLAPDGKKVALDVNDARNGNSDVWIYSSSGGIPTRFTSHPAFDAEPIWSPDGRQIVFMSYRDGRQDLYQKNSSGAGTEDDILHWARTNFPTDWSPDGRFILFRALEAKSNLELWVIQLAGDRKPIPFVKGTFGASDGQFSPDGHWVAYSSNESGKWEIYVAPFPGPGGNWKVSTAGGTQPRWRRDGRELFYLAPDAKLMAVEVVPGPTFEASAAIPLFQTRPSEPVSANDLFNYDVSADGQRFLINTEIDEAASSPLMLVVNWTRTLKQ